MSSAPDAKPSLPFRGALWRFLVLLRSFLNQELGQDSTLFLIFFGSEQAIETLDIALYDKYFIVVRHKRTSNRLPCNLNHYHILAPFNSAV